MAAPDGPARRPSHEPGRRAAGRRPFDYGALRLIVLAHDRRRSRGTATS